MKIIGLGKIKSYDKSKPDKTWLTRAKFSIYIFFQMVFLIDINLLLKSHSFVNIIL
jgi:hypothetical protein